MIKLKRRAYKKILITAILLPVCLTIFARITHADYSQVVPFQYIPDWVWRPYPGDGTQTTPNYLGRCDDTANPRNHYSAGQYQWLAQDTTGGVPQIPPNYPDLTKTVSATVPAGTNYVDMFLVGANTECYDPGNGTLPVETWYTVDSVSVDNGASIPVFPNKLVYDIGYPGFAKDYYVNVYAISFRVNLPAGLAVGPHTYNVNFSNGASINHFRNPNTGVNTYQCVQSGQAGSGADGIQYSDFADCAKRNPSYSFIINVTNPTVSPVLTCNSVTPSQIEANKNTTVKVNFSNAAGSDSLTGANMTVTIPGLLGATPYGFNPNPLSGGVSADSDPIPINNPPPGSYAVNLNFSGGNSPSGTISCPALKVVTKPYFRVYHGDISAGMGLACDGWTGIYDTVTSPLARATIQAFNNGGGSYSGAGSTLAAQAIDSIDQFATDSASATAAGPPRGLTLANLAGTYGGFFGIGGTHCPIDYFAASDGTTISSSTLFANLKPNGTYVKSGNLRVFNTAPTYDGKITVYVDGNVNIVNNISYDTTGWSANDVPLFRLIVKGNIYISPGVTRLDGIYIAQPNTPVIDDDSSNGGYIYTCAHPPYAKPSSSEIATSCRNNLRVTGSLVAVGFRLYKSNGTLFQATPNESANDNIAETFTYSPEVWLSQIGTGCDPTCGIDAITSLPPVL